MAKTDQPGFFEKHAEKITLALAVIFLGFILFTKVFVSPHRTDEIGASSELVEPAKIDEALASEAKNAATAIERRKQELPKVANKVGLLKHGLDNNVSAWSPGRTPSFVNLTSGSKALTLAAGPVGGEIPDALSPVPALTEIKVWTGPELVIKNGQDRFASSKPTELSAAHITAVLDYGAMTGAWLKELDRPGIPLEVVFLRVVAERQKKTPAGDWGPTEEIASETITGDRGELLRPDVPAFDGKNLAAIQAALSQLQDPGAQDSIVNPGYYPVYWPEARTFAGWTHHLPATSVNELDTAVVAMEQVQPRPILRAKQQAGRGRSAGRTGAKGRRTGRTRNTAMNTGGMPGMGGMGAMGGMGGMGAMGGMGGMGGMGAMGGMPTGPTGATGRGRGGRDDSSEAKNQRNVNMANQALEKALTLETERDFVAAKREYTRAVKLFELVQNMGGPVNNTTLLQAREGVARCDMPHPTPIPSLGNMCKSGKVQVWTHDTACEAGATYRYRLRIEVLNPLFNVQMTPSTTVDDAPAMAVVTSSDWSAPVSVPARTNFFAVAGKSAKEKVDIMIFRRTMGQVLSEKVSVGIGEEIGTLTTKDYLLPGMNSQVPATMDVDFSTGYTIVDCAFEKGQTLSSKAAKITLLAPSGELITRTVETDRGSELLDSLSEENEQVLDELDRMESGL